jgi:diguanylate cyclase (GGDEF)-like protein
MRALLNQPRFALSVGLLAAAISIGAPLGIFGGHGELALNVVWLGAILASIKGILSLPRSARGPWLLVAASLILMLVCAALREHYNTLGDVSTQRSLIPDLAAGPGYLLLVAAMAGIVRDRRRGVDGGVDTLLDGLLCGLASLALAWVYVLEPAIATTPMPFGSGLSVIGYLAVSVVLVVLTAQLAFSAGERLIVSQVFAVVAMLFMLIGDLLYTLTDARLISLDASVVMTPYALTFSSLTYMYLHPSMGEFAQPIPPQRKIASPTRLAFVAVALLVPAIVSTTALGPAGGSRYELTAIIMLTTMVATARVLRALQSHAHSERALLFQATHDILTGALNRSGLLLELEKLDRDGVPHAVLFIDMDRFKLVNDTYGHSFGDELLMSVAARLRRVRPEDLVARIGGDEFVVVTCMDAGSPEAVAAAEMVRGTFADPFMIDGAEIPVSISVGITTSDEVAGPVAMLRDADTAMYRAKDSGRDAVVLFDGAMRDQVSFRLELERELHHALKRGELAVYFQPIVDMTTGEPQGFEALMRWHHPMLGNVGPLTFIPVAEETGLIVEIGAWIVDQACRHLAEWRSLGPAYSHLRVSVNVSARQLRDADFSFMVNRALVFHGLPAAALSLEVTESILINESITIPRVLDQIRESGISLSIDDFGTGYSSLAYVQRFPFQTVKIDRSFVTPLDKAGGENQLVGAIVAMAQALGLSTIAEGVETLEQQKRLVELGCHTAQGFLYSRPVPAEQIPATLRRLAQAQHRPPVHA